MHRLLLAAISPIFPARDGADVLVKLTQRVAPVHLVWVKRADAPYDWTGTVSSVAATPRTRPWVSAPGFGG